MTGIDHLLETRSIVEAEIEEHIKRNAEKFGGTRLGFFNNFWTKLHDDGVPTFTNIRFLHITSGTYHTTHKEQLGNTRGYSQRFLDLTPDEFFRDVDQALAEEGISGARIWELARQLSPMTELPPETQKQIIRESFDLQLAVYTRLRAIGYGHRELIV